MISKSFLNILLIEDNPGDVHLIKHYLKDASIKHNLLVADTLYEGTTMLNTNDVSLILLDLSLPDSLGFKTLTTLMEKAASIPIIVLTGMNNEIIGEQAVKAGAQDFLVKGGLEAKILSRSIRYAMQRYSAKLKLEDTARNLVMSKNRYIEVQEIAHFGSWEMDIVTNEMTWSDEMFRIFGFAPNSFDPSLADYIKYVHPDDKEKVVNFFESVSKIGQLQRIEHSIVTNNQTTIKTIVLQAKVFYNDLNQKIVLLGAAQDISERKISEKLVAEKQISKKALQIREEVLSTLSFLVRTPLSSLMNFVFLLEKITTSGAQKELVDGMRASVDELSINMLNLLNYSSMWDENLKPQNSEIRLLEILNGLKKIIQLQADSMKVNLEMTIETSTIPEVVQGDLNKLFQVLYNVIYVSINQITPKNKIRIVISAIQSENGVAHLKVAMKDGAGLTDTKTINLAELERNLDKIAEASDEVSKRKFTLAITNKIVNVIGGGLKITSFEQDCVRNTIEVPLKIVRVNGEHLNNDINKPIRILLVDDHFLNQMANKKILTSWSEHVTVDIAENGIIAVEKVREHGYDIVLMDIQMPVMNGIDATSRIRSFSQVPIIAVSAQCSKNESDKCLKVGMDDYIAKPFKPEELYSKIKKALAENLSHKLLQ